MSRRSDNVEMSNAVNLPVRRSLKRYDFFNDLSIGKGEGGGGGRGGCIHM